MIDKVKWMGIEIIHFFACLIIPLLTGVIFYFISRNRVCIIGGFFVGILIWVLHVFLRSGCIRLFIKECDQDDKLLLDKADEDIKICYSEVKQVFFCRDYAAKRLMQDEFWIQRISIYYSVFTAILSLLGLVGETNNDFLDLPSVIFTVAVAILVTFANAQRCGARANDLYMNCNDLGERYTELALIIGHLKKEGIDEKNIEDYHSRLENCMSSFHKNCGDSEAHSIVDEWKYKETWLYYVYLASKIVAVYLIIIIPIVFVFYNWENFGILYASTIKK